MSTCVQESHRPWSPPASGPGRGVGDMEGLSAKRARDESLVPLVIPVSVPVRRADPSNLDQEQTSLSASWPQRLSDPNRTDHKPSVIVTRRRSLRNSLSESSSQVSVSLSRGSCFQTIISSCFLIPCIPHPLKPGLKLPP